MKKLISFVMAAAMVASLVPATAFAAEDSDVMAKAKVIKAAELQKGEDAVSGPELQLTIDSAQYKEMGGAEPTASVTFTLDNAEFGNATVIVVNEDGVERDDVSVVVTKDDKNEVTAKFTGKFAKGDKIVLNLASELTKTSAGTKATVSVDSDDIGFIGGYENLVYATILDKGITATVKKLAEVAPEESTTLEKDLKIKSKVGKFVVGQTFELKLSKGFEFGTVKGGEGYDVDDKDGNVATIVITAETDEIVIDAADMEIIADSAKVDAVATLTVKALKDKEITGTFAATATVEVAKVIDMKVVMSVDEDEDVPVIYSGVDVQNTGITDDSDHLSLEVTLKETFAGAWNVKKAFSLELPEGVYVTDVTDVSCEQLGLEAGNFADAYQKGDHVFFDFAKKILTDTEGGKAGKITFKLQLVADPDFEGDVELTLKGDALETQKVTIAKFVKPYTVKAAQNDLRIDYRYTAIPTAIEVTEAAAGLWSKKDGAEFIFHLERNIDFDGDATFVVDAESGMEIKSETKDGNLKFKVTAASDEDPATVTIKDMALYMGRNIPAGPYSLLLDTTLLKAYKVQDLFAPDYDDKKETGEGIIKHVSKFDGDTVETVKEAFVNVITAGREQDDASFTTKVVVPVGESYVISGENKIEIDTPAYINAAGYTMLPVRAVAVALGINTQNVLWNGPTKTVTILYGQRIITMTAGQKVVNVNGSVLPASSAVEIVNSRAFLPMRDLATALGVTDITWDASTRTATLNGSQK
ncbi:MAG: copper amine oxidase N-terminal domain-containing protein [Anaerotignum sp.]|nr:copper amine oxidase N-terminal domain-containing protein [Anaerotignum sp.]